jgi:cellulose synthase/poly-beta-1,6-N-acetylglucosamine synthase-like glycosyltransferase
LIRERESGDRPSLSVVMGLYDGLPHLVTQLDALAAQDYGGPSETIIVDNGSRDGSGEVARSYGDRIYAASLASGEALVFVDQDDQVAPGYLDAMGAALVRNEFVAARIDHAFLNPEWSRGSRSSWQSEGLMETGFLPCASGCSLGMRRRAYERVGGFDEQFASAQDIDLCWRAQLVGIQIAFAPTAVLRYRYREGLLEHFRQERRWGADDVRIYRRYRPVGLPKRSIRGAVNDWRLLASRMATARSRTEWAWCVGSLGRRLGRLETSVELRMLYP